MLGGGGGRWGGVSAKSFFINPLFMCTASIVSHTRLHSENQRNTRNTSLHYTLVACWSTDKTQSAKYQEITGLIQPSSSRGGRENIWFNRMYYHVYYLNKYRMCDIHRNVTISVLKLRFFQNLNNKRLKQQMTKEQVNWFWIKI